MIILFQKYPKLGYLLPRTKRWHMQTVRRQRHDCVVVVRLDESIVRVIDQEAEAEGLTRSAIIRRVLKLKYEPESRATQ